MASGNSALTHHFTARATGRIDVITTPIRVSSTPSDAAAYQGVINYHNANGLWDTGATNSCITASLATLIGAMPTGVAEVHGVHGPALANTYLVDIILPNNVLIKQVRTTELAATVGGFDLLIGMDIINMGDFCITNANGNTVFTFRLPSVAEIDFSVPPPLIPVKPRGSNFMPPQRPKKRK